MRLRASDLLIVCLLATFVAAGALAAPKPPLATPTLSCGIATPSSVQIQVCAGSTGAAGGFSLHWLPAAQLALGPDGISGTADDGTWPSEMCEAGFSGNAAGSTFSLGAFECVTVQVGDTLFDLPGASSNCASVPLDCATAYAFRAFAHAASAHSRSAFTTVHTCSTAPCTTDPGCTYTQGYWKSHGPLPSGNNENEWPVSALMLGSVVYTDLELQAILDRPAKGNGLINLAHQLIAAKLNLENGADGTDVAVAITAADALIGALIVPPVGSGEIASSETSALVGILTQFNEGAIGPGHCDDEEVPDQV